MEYGFSDFEMIAEPIVTHNKMLSSQNYIQHGNTSVFSHSVAVAAHSFDLAKKLHIRCDQVSLVRGALLHDFFLYDWHITKKFNGRLHGFEHPNTAYQNAAKYFQINDIESDIIRKHMWPLTLTKIPRCRESWLVCAVDKYCSVLEIMGLNKYNDHTYIENILCKKRQETFG